MLLFINNQEFLSLTITIFFPNFLGWLVFQVINSFNIGIANLYICRITSCECEQGRTFHPLVHYYFAFYFPTQRSPRQYRHMFILTHCYVAPGQVHQGLDQGLSFSLLACFAKRKAATDSRKTVLYMNYMK